MTALVCALLGVGPAAVVLGLVSRRRVRRDRLRGGVLALVAVLLGSVLTVAAVAAAVVVVVSLSLSRPLTTDITAAREARARQLTTGHCLASLPADGPVDRVTVVPCAQPHEAQVITALTLDAARWPGQRTVDRRVALSCGLTEEERSAGVRPVVWSPTEESWDRGDRTGLCLLVVDGGGVTGSFLDGSAQLP
ncbi:septum formation family protein [Cellulomonas hominis]